MSSLAPAERDERPPAPERGRILTALGGPSSTDWLVAAGAAILAVATAVAALQVLSFRPAILPAFLGACAIFPLVLTRPRWVVPVFFGIVWTFIGQRFFGGFSPPTMGAAILLPLAAWYALTRPQLAREAFTTIALFALPLVASSLLSESGEGAPPVDAFKNLAFLPIAALCIRSTRDTERVGAVLIVTGIFLSLGALYTVQVGPTELFPENDLPDEYGNPPPGPPRAAGPFGEANFFALSLAAIVPFCIYMIGRGGWRILLGGVGVLLLIAGDFAAQSRGGAIAMLFAIFVMAFSSGSRRLRAAAVGLVVFFGLMLVVFSASVESAGERSVEGRATENRIAVQMFLDHPFTGVGPGQYPENYRTYSRELGNDPRPVRAPHSLPLEIAAEQGIFGMLGWAGVAVLLLRYARATRIWRDPLGRAVATAILTYCVGSLFLHGSQLRVLFILLGLLLAHGAAVVRERAGEKPA